jgi:hypothetical protein
MLANTSEFPTSRSNGEGAAGKAEGCPAHAPSLPSACDPGAGASGGGFSYSFLFLFTAEVVGAGALPGGDGRCGGTR